MYGQWYLVLPFSKGSLGAKPAGQYIGQISNFLQFGLISCSVLYLKTFRCIDYQRSSFFAKNVRSKLCMPASLSKYLKVSFNSQSGQRSDRSTLSTIR